MKYLKKYESVNIQFHEISMDEFIDIRNKNNIGNEFNKPDTIEFFTKKDKLFILNYIEEENIAYYNTSKFFKSKSGNIEYCKQKVKNIEDFLKDDCNIIIQNTINQFEIVKLKDSYYVVILRREIYLCDDFTGLVDLLAKNLYPIQYKSPIRINKL